MSTAGPEGARGAGAGWVWKTALTAALLVGGAAVLYVIASAVATPGAGAGGLSGLNRGAMAKLEIVGDPQPATPVVFAGPKGQAVHLADFKGRAVVLNLWATWCPPCVKEMPTLATLQTAEAGKPLKVIAVSMDQAAQTEQAKAFMASHPPLGFYQDAKFAFVSDFNPHIMGFPTTVLIDREGRERAILSGEADWSSPEAKAVVERLAGL